MSTPVAEENSSSEVSSPAENSMGGSGASGPVPQVVVVPTVVVPVVVPVPVAIPVAVPAKNADCFGEAECADKPAAEEPVVRRERTAEGAFSRSWKRFGGTGFAVSAVFHFALVIFALFYAFSALEDSTPDVSAFISGSGGSSAARGERFSQKAFRKIQEVRSPKIFSKNRETSVVLPELPKMPAVKSLGFSGGLRGSGEGDPSGGSDISGSLGSGGGIGLGSGVGIGNGSNYLGKFKTLLGAKIKARKIAVYLDCSGSMKSFLPAVKEEIYEKFPDADVFAFSGAKTEVADGEILGGRAMRAKKLAAFKGKRANDETEANKLSGQGRVIYGKFSGHLAAGALGAWIDIFLRERYDALVVFSDFRDGIRQRRDGKTVYADSSYAPADDERTPRERAWEKEWGSAFSRKNAPKLYLFSVKTPPQDFLRTCVEHSGGEITILNLKKRRNAERDKN